MQPYASLGKVGNPFKNATNNSNTTINTLDEQAKSLTTPHAKYTVDTLGLAVFKDNKMVGTLSGIETMCHLLVTNKFDSCVIDIPSPIDSNETINLYLYSAENTKNKVSIINSSPFVKTNVNVSAKLLSSNSDKEILTQEKLAIIQDSANKYLSDQLNNYFYKTSKEYNSDIAGIGRFAIKNFKTSQDWKDYNWLENYQNAVFKVNVELSIRTGILLTTE